MATPKATHQIKNLLVTELTRAWLEAEEVKNPSLTQQEIIRNRLHEIALGDLQCATLLIDAATRLGIRSDGA